MAAVAESKTSPPLPPLSRSDRARRFIISHYAEFSIGCAICAAVTFLHTEGFSSFAQMVGGEVRAALLVVAAAAAWPILALNAHRLPGGRWMNDYPLCAVFLIAALSLSELPGRNATAFAMFVFGSIWGLLGAAGLFTPLSVWVSATVIDHLCRDHVGKGKMNLAYFAVDWLVYVFVFWLHW